MKVGPWLLMLGVGWLTAGETRVFLHDPVALLDGRELIGSEELAAEYQGIHYRFAEASNRVLFQQDPDRYAVRQGGACARMGPLSGLGNPDLFTVYRGGLYIFGSQECRETFLADPSKTFDPDQAIPEIRDEAAAQGRKWLEKLIAATGGAERLDALASYRERRREDVVRQGKTWSHFMEHGIVFPDRFFREERWNELVYKRVREGERGWFDDNGARRDMAPVQVRAMKREFMTHPLVLLRARGQDGFHVAFTGEETFGDRPAVRILVAWQGMNQTLLVDRETGRLLGQRYRARGPRALYGELERVYSGYHEIQGLSLPAEVAVRYEREPWQKHAFEVILDE